MLTPWLLSWVLAPTNLVPNPGFEMVAANGLPAAWAVVAPRDETMPNLLRDATGGLDGSAAAVLTGIGERTCGAWRAVVEGLEPGHGYRVGASYRTENVARDAPAVWLKLTWIDAAGEPLRTDYVNRRSSLTGDWRRTEDLLDAPLRATGVELELWLRWTAGTVWFDDVLVAPAVPPAPRKVKLAAVCFLPAGGTPDSNRRAWAAKAAEAGRQGARLVCLGEGIALVGTGLSLAEVAEPVPGPTTTALAEVARAADLYLVAGVYEQDGKALYNTAVLVGPAGLIGRYRKVHLPESEVVAGFTPGREYPVFETPLGRIGLQICYDNDFPESARALALNGAEIICTPIWGDGRFGDTAWDVLPRARAMDNGVWFVASNYSQKRSLVVDPWGAVRADTAGREGIVVVEADLAERRQTPWLSSRAGAAWETIYRQERRPEAYGDLTR